MAIDPDVAQLMTIRSTLLPALAGAALELADEADAAEGMIFGFAEDVIEIGKADGREGFERVRHEPLAAGFMDRGLHGIDDFDVKTLTGGGDGRGQSGWASAYYKDITSGTANVHFRLPFLPLEQNKL